MDRYLRLVLDDVTIRRRLEPGTYPLRDVVEGLGSSEGLARIVEDVPAFLDSVTVQILDRRGYMWVHGSKGHLMVSRWHLRGASKVVLYLDFVHELVHVKQFREGHDLYDEGHDYVDRPTEIEAYRATIAEARDLGLDDGFIEDYLRVEWVNEEDHERLKENVGFEAG